MRTGKHGIAMTLVLGLALAGCASEENGTITGSPQVGVDDYDHMDFNTDFGGLTATDEEEAFGDGFLLSLLAAEVDEEADDPLLLDPEVLQLEQMASQPAQPDHRLPRFTFLRISWGLLEGEVDSLGRFAESIDLLDWTGMLRVDRGIVIVRRLVRFERPYDHLVYPRIDRRTVAWFSHTGRHFDGLLVEIIERPEDLADGDRLQPNRLHFVTGPFAQSFVVAELPGLDQVHPVEPADHGIHFTGFRLSDIAQCPKGFLSGIWISHESARGQFRGRWVGLLGHTHGFLRGAWGVNDEGERVFFGKYIGHRGRFQGFLTGTWEPVGDRPGHGIFRGQWANEEGGRQGVLGGRTFSLPTRPCGFFAGRWANDCDPAATDAIN